MATPNGAKLLGEEMIDIAQALDDLECEPGKKRSTNPPEEMQVAPKPKKRRRRRHEIARNFKCNMHGCSKSYGSEGALKTHIRLKHTESAEKQSNQTTAGAPILLPQIPVLKTLAGEVLQAVGPPRAQKTIERSPTIPEDNLKLPNLFTTALPQFQLSNKPQLPHFNSLFQ